eukprot:3369933-Lingulodinium_polyedra.AAC.1
MDLFARYGNVQVEGFYCIACEPANVRDQPSRVCTQGQHGRNHAVPEGLPLSTARPGPTDPALIHLSPAPQ